MFYFSWSSWYVGLANHFVDAHLCRTDRQISQLELWYFLDQVHRNVELNSHVSGLGWACASPRYLKMHMGMGLGMKIFKRYWGSTNQWDTIELCLERVSNDIIFITHDSCIIDQVDGQNNH